MTNHININLEYSSYVSETVELPKGKTFNDIEDWYTKWGVFNYKIEGVWHREELGNDDVQTDYKRPSHTMITDADTHELLAE